MAKGAGRRGEILQWFSPQGVGLRNHDEVIMANRTKWDNTASFPVSHKLTVFRFKAYPAF